MSVLWRPVELGPMAIRDFSCDLFNEQKADLLHY